MNPRSTHNCNLCDTNTGPELVFYAHSSPRFDSLCREKVQHLPGSYFPWIASLSGKCGRLDQLDWRYAYLYSASAFCTSGHFYADFCALWFAEPINFVLHRVLNHDRTVSLYKSDQSPNIYSWSVDLYPTSVIVLRISVTSVTACVSHPSSGTGPIVLKLAVGVTPSPGRL